MDIKNLMKPDISKLEHFSGIHAAVLTPMYPDGRCNVSALAKHCEDLFEQGCQGIVLFGTTGEGLSFSLEERKTILKALVDIGISASKIIVSVGCTAIAETVELTKAALELQCAGVLMVPPFFYKKIRDEGIIATYREVIKRVDNADLKLLLYHIPQMSGIHINLNIIQALYQEFPKIVIGIKESEGNKTFTESILEQVKGFKVFIGNERNLQEGLAKGAVGGIFGLANICAPLLCAIFKGSRDSAEIEPIIDVIRNYPTIPALKALIASKKGEDWKYVRPPLMCLNSDEIAKLAKDLPHLLK